MTEIEQLRADNARLLELLANCHDSMRESSKQISELTASLISKCMDNRVNAGCDLSRREMFAAMAMHGFCANPAFESVSSSGIAIVSLEHSDALIDALSESSQKGGE